MLDSLARSVEKTKIDFNIYMEYELINYYGDVVDKSRIYSEFSQQEYII